MTTYSFLRILCMLPAAVWTGIGAHGAQEKPGAKPVPDIELGAPFADNAILQREKDLPVWGWSKPGTSVTVEFAAQKGTVTAGADGRWIVKLAPLKASAEPAQMSISDGAGCRVVLKNFLVGEVWHAGGPSSWIAGSVRFLRSVLFRLPT